MENVEGWSIDAELAFPAMQALGWQIDTLPWRTANVDWNQFDAVYIGTPWDYPEDPQQFVRVLESIDRSVRFLSTTSRWFTGQFQKHISGTWRTWVHRSSPASGVTNSNPTHCTTHFKDSPPTA